MITFIKHTLPKPLLVALLYRLTILHFASRVLPRIGGDGWDDEYGVAGGWEGRPVSWLSRYFDTFDIKQLSLEYEVNHATTYIPTNVPGHSLFTSPP